jgi:hypothetical protein
MATEKIDPRAVIEKMDAEVQAAADALKKLQEENEAKRKLVLKELREADLADVKAKCKLHGFTASQLRSVLATKGASKKADTKSAAKKPAAKKRAAKAS